jgi:glycosyltransferase involved in cell wall biosynthesis
VADTGGIATSWGGGVDPAGIGSGLGGQGRVGLFMRALFVADNAPWPALGGALIRLSQVVESVAAVADLDLFILHDPVRTKVVIPPAVPVHRWTGTPYPRTSPQLRWRLEWAVRPGLPLEVAMARADRTPRLALRDWARPPYDVVWFERAPSFEWTGRPDLGPTIVDLDDLEDVKARLRAELLADQLRHTRAPGTLHTRLARIQTQLNARDWGRSQRSIAAQVEKVVVPSDRDAFRSGLANVAVVPNTYPRPARPVGNPSGAGPPVVLFQGSLDYPPNIDGAKWLDTVVVPRIRAVVPETEVRLVGQAATSVKLLHRAGGLTVIGQVPSMEDELARASVAVVPIRFGSGTRIKILESFAHNVPVVSTTLGAEGLEVEDGVHLLLADDPEEFAAAVVRVLRDPVLRVRLTEAAQSLYLAHYDGRAVREAIRRLLEEVAGVRTRS